MKDPNAARFWSKVDVSRGPDACWPWMAGVFKDGYGKFHHSTLGSGKCAHRISYELSVGPIPPGMLVCHRCDNPPCVNPAHLFLGTNADNMSDCISKGRHVPNRGETNGRAKLTEDDVRAIRAIYGTGPTKVAIAAMFGVSQTQIRQIISRESWVSVV